MNKTTPPQTLEVVADPRPAFGEASNVARTIVAGLRPGHDTLPTPAGMDVGELLSHLVLAMRQTALIGKAAAEFGPAESLEVTVATAARLLDDALAEAAAAWALDAVLCEPRPLPWEPAASGSEALAVFTSELIVHTWDLAKASGQDLAYSDDTIGVALAVMAKQLPMPQRAPIWESAAAQIGVTLDDFDAPFADAVPIAEDAPLLDRLIAWNGRKP